jgi:uridine kinase
MVYLELTMPLRLWRRLLRDRRERGHSLAYVIRQTVLETLPGEREFILPLKPQADLVIQNSTAGLATLTEHARSLLVP